MGIIKEAFAAPYYAAFGRVDEKFGEKGIQTFNRIVFVIKVVFALLILVFMIQRDFESIAVLGGLVGLYGIGGLLISKSDLVRKGRVATITYEMSEVAKLDNMLAKKSLFQESNLQKLERLQAELRSLTQD